MTITSLGEERANLSVFRTFVRFVPVWFCRFSLPLVVCKGPRFVIVALPGLFSHLFYFYFYLFIFFFFFFFYYFALAPAIHTGTSQRYIHKHHRDAYTNITGTVTTYWLSSWASFVTRHLYITDMYVSFL